MDEQTVYDEATESRKTLLWWLYLMHGASLFFSLGVFSFIPLIFNYLKRDETNGTWLRSHHSWQIRSFWWYLFWVCVGWIAFITILGIPLAIVIFAGAFIWKAYRLIKGFLDLDDGKAMPMPAEPEQYPQ